MNSCAASRSTKVALGAYGDYYVAGCGYEAYEIAERKKASEYGIFRLPGGPKKMASVSPNPFLFESPEPTPTPTPEPTPAPGTSTESPSEGDVLSGDFQGYGRRVISDETANHSIEVDIIFHATDYSVILNRMQELGCFK